MEKNYTILIVEDDPITIKLIDKMISDMGYMTLLSEDGKDAMRKVKSEAPDLVITDIMMPGYSGLQLLNFITKKVAKKIPVLLISSHNKEIMAEMSQEVDAAGFLSKPVLKEELSQKVKETLRAYSS